MKNDQTPMESNKEIRTLKTGSCLSLSGRSTITYEIGCKGDKAIHLRLTENTGSGMFSKAWIPVAQIDLLLSADDKPITSSTIRSLYTRSCRTYRQGRCLTINVALPLNLAVGLLLIIAESYGQW